MLPVDHGGKRRALDHTSWDWSLNESTYLLATDSQPLVDRITGALPTEAEYGHPRETAFPSVL